MAIDVGAILARAYQTVIKNRILWVMGFLVAIMSGIGNNNFRISGNEHYQVFNTEVTISPAAGAAIICTGLLLALAFFFLRAILDAGLIAAGDRSSRDDPPTFGETWKAGVAGMWPVIALNLIFAAFVILLLLAAILFVGATAVGAAVAGLFSGPAPDAIRAVSIVGSALLALLVLVLIGFPLAIFLGVVTQIAQRAAVLDHEGIGQAWRTGWRVMRTNLGNVLVILLTQFLVNLLVGIITAAILVPLLGLPVLALAGGNVVETAGGIAVIVLLAGVAWMLGGAITALPTAWSSLLWTLFYRAVTFSLPQATGPQARYGGQMPPTVQGGYPR